MFLKKGGEGHKVVKKNFLMMLVASKALFSKGT